MKVLELNEKDEQTFLQLLDIAIKAGGLNVAQAALALAGKMQEKMEIVDDALRISDTGYKELLEDAESSD